MTVINLTTEHFDKLVFNHDLVVVDFWAKWCGPCLAFSPIFDKVAEKHPDVTFAKVNIDEEPSLASDFNIQSIPFLMIFRREFAIFAQPGIQTATSLDNLINDAKKIEIATLRQQLNKK